MAKYRILSFDGGGIKGLFTSVVIKRLTVEYPRLLENVDLLAGTSTGGIIAIALAAGKSPDDLIALYSEEADRIFDDSFWDDLVDLGNAIGADYDNKKLKRLLKRELGEKRLRDLRRRVLIPAFDLDAPAKGKRPRMWKPKFFHNFPGSDSDGGEQAVDVALRTSAAPTYFPSHDGYIDGGVVANNPSMSAVAQALDPRGAGMALGDLLVLSIGTGIEPKYIAKRKVDWGWGQWARPMIDLMISGVMGVADFQCQQLLGDRYQRIDTYFDRGVDLDDVESRTVDYLITQADALPLHSYVTWLQAHGW